MTLLAAPVVSLLFFSVLAVAQISAPACSTTSGWEWSYNSLGQNACMVAAYMMSTCNWGSFTVYPLPPGVTYSGPTGVDNSNLCKCSTVVYSLISACAGCQGVVKWISWSEYVTNCTKTLPPSFPNPIPSGTRVPQWALLDVTNENFWDSNKSYATGDSPELGPGTVIGASSSSASVSASTTSSSNTNTSIPVHGHSSNAGAIAGGVVGGIAAISILIAALLFYLVRRRRSLEPVVVFEGDGARHMDRVQFPMSDQRTLAETLPETMPPPEPYIPDDPTTYPEYQGVLPPPAYTSGPIPPSSPNGSLYTVATPSSSKAQRYRGVPIV